MCLILCPLCWLQHRTEGTRPPPSGTSLCARVLHLGSESSCSHAGSTWQETGCTQPLWPSSHARAFLACEGGSPLERLVNSTSRLWLNKQLSRRLRRLRFICFGGSGAGSLGRGACWGHTGGRLQLPARVTQRPGPIKGKRGQVWSGGDLEYLPSRGQLLGATVCNGRRRTG